MFAVEKKRDFVDKNKYILASTVPNHSTI